MENNKYRNTNDINDAEYRQMRKSEDSSYEYHGADAEDIDEANADNGYGTPGIPHNCRSARDPGAFHSTVLQRGVCQ